MNEPPGCRLLKGENLNNPQFFKYKDKKYMITTTFKQIKGNPGVYIPFTSPSERMMCLDDGKTLIFLSKNKSQEYCIEAVDDSWEDNDKFFVSDEIPMVKCV